MYRYLSRSRCLEICNAIYTYDSARSTERSTLIKSDQIYEHPLYIGLTMLNGIVMKYNIMHFHITYKLT